jgi:NTE family protein
LNRRRIVVAADASIGDHIAPVDQLLGLHLAVWRQLGAPDAAGSFAQFKARYVEPTLAFGRQKIDVGDILSGFQPWTSAARQVETSYDNGLFRGFKLQALPDRPQFVFCATNLQTGVNFRFSKLYAGDYIVGRIANPDISLSTAVTASSAFPPFLSPLVLTPPAGSFTDWPGQPAGAGGVIDPGPFRAKVFLTDGGVYDNHGLEPTVKRTRDIRTRSIRRRHSISGQPSRAGQAH